MIQLGLDKVYPSAGHHNKDSGAVANGYVERDEMKRMRNLVLSYLGNHPNASDKDSERNSTYQNRIRRELHSGDVVCDMHLNAGPPSATGVSVFISNNAGKDSENLAKEMVDGLARIMGIRNRGVRREFHSQHNRIGILNLPGTAILIEFCFITNAADMRAYKANEKGIAKFVAELIKKYDRND